MLNGMTSTDYDMLGRMKFWKNTNASSTVLNEYQYGYNNANQIISITEPTRTRTIGYDNADRLTGVTSTQSGQNENYSYDDVGNRTASHLSSTYGYQSGAFNRLTSTQTASYSFDANGNLTSKSEGTTKWYYFYDRENRLVNATKFGGLMPRAGQSVGYQYDALGRRVVRQDKKTGRTEFTHDGLDVIQDRFEKSDGTNSTTNYINGLGIDDKLKVTSGTSSKYFLTDHLGSTTGLTDSNGTVTESASYDSFGRVQSSNLTTRYGYTGREQDEATGLMYYRARFYDPLIGRFISEDPIGFEGGDVNLYGYVLNDPLSYTDPLGEAIWIKVVKLVNRTFRTGRKVTMKQAQNIRRNGGNVMASNQRTARQIETGAFKNDPSAGKQLRHDPHGEGYNPHYQTNNKIGHTFYGGIAIFFAPFTVEVSENGCATNGQLASALLWDVAGNVDPIGVTDLLNWIFGLNPRDSDDEEE